MFGGQFADAGLGLPFYQATSGAPGLLECSVCLSWPAEKQEHTIVRDKCPNKGTNSSGQCRRKCWMAALSIENSCEMAILDGNLGLPCTYHWVPK